MWVTGYLEPHCVQGQISHPGYEFWAAGGSPQRQISTPKTGAGSCWQVVGSLLLCAGSLPRSRCRYRKPFPPPQPPGIVRECGFLVGGRGFFWTRAGKRDMIQPKSNKEGGDIRWRRKKKPRQYPYWIYRQRS